MLSEKLKKILELREKDFPQDLLKSNLSLEECLTMTEEETALAEDYDAFDSNQILGIITQKNGRKNELLKKYVKEENEHFMYFLLIKLSEREEADPIEKWDKLLEVLENTNSGDGYCSFKELKPLLEALYCCEFEITDVLIQNINYFANNSRLEDSILLDYIKYWQIIYATKFNFELAPTVELFDRCTFLESNINTEIYPLWIAEETFDEYKATVTEIAEILGEDAGLFLSASREATLAEVKSILLDLKLGITEKAYVISNPVLFIAAVTTSGMCSELSKYSCVIEVPEVIKFLCWLLRNDHIGVVESLCSLDYVSSISNHFIFRGNEEYKMYDFSICTQENLEEFFSCKYWKLCDNIKAKIPVHFFSNIRRFSLKYFQLFQYLLPSCDSTHAVFYVEKLQQAGALAAIEKPEEIQSIARLLAQKDFFEYYNELNVEVPAHILIQILLNGHTDRLQEIQTLEDALFLSKSDIVIEGSLEQSELEYLKYDFDINQLYAKLKEVPDFSTLNRNLLKLSLEGGIKQILTFLSRRRPRSITKNLIKAFHTYLQGSFEVFKCSQGQVQKELNLKVPDHTVDTWSEDFCYQSDYAVEEHSDLESVLNAGNLPELNNCNPADGEYCDIIISLLSSCKKVLYVSRNDEILASYELTLTKYVTASYLSPGDPFDANVEPGNEKYEYTYSKVNCDEFEDVKLGLVLHLIKQKKALDLQEQKEVEAAVSGYLKERSLTLEASVLKVNYANSDVKAFIPYTRGGKQFLFTSTANNVVDEGNYSDARIVL